MSYTPQDPGDVFGQGPPVSGNEPSMKPRPWYKKKRFFTPLVLFLFFAALSAAIGNDNNESPKNPTTTVGKESPKNPTTTSKAPTPTSPTPGPTNSTTQTSIDKSSGTLPDLRGQDLQAAQDAAQASGFYGLTSHDATGQGRLQVLDRNWKVCSQSPAAGTHKYNTVVDFGAVKDEESCPSVSA